MNTITRTVGEYTVQVITHDYVFVAKTTDWDGSEEQLNKLIEADSAMLYGRDLIDGIPYYWDHADKNVIDFIDSVLMDWHKFRVDTFSSGVLQMTNGQAFTYDEADSTCPAALIDFVNNEAYWLKSIERNADGEPVTFVVCTLR